MSSRTLTGLLLIIGPIFMVVGYGGWIGLSGNVDQSDTQAVIDVLGEKGESTKPFGLITLMGLVLTLAGIGGVRNSMGGTGHVVAGLGFLLMVIGMAGGHRRGWVLPRHR